MPVNQIEAMKTVAEERANRILCAYGKQNCEHQLLEVYFKYTPQGPEMAAFVRDLIKPYVDIG